MSFKIGIIGLGTIGGGVVKLLADRRAELIRDYNCDIELVRVCNLDDKRLKELGIPQELYTEKIEEFLKTPMDAIVELVGGDRFLEVIKSALQEGKKVITANKSMLASHGSEVIGKSEGRLYFEASCLGGIPVISLFEEGLTANRIEALYGIFNGTCNYILTQMSSEGWDYERALAEAQKLGFAEANPTADVEGHDATQKLSILSSLSFGAVIPWREIEMEGISQLRAADFAWAKKNGYKIKLISMAEKPAGFETLFLGTFPVLVPIDNPLAHVDGPENAITFKGHAVGLLSLRGPGAGEMPTAGAVVSDIIAAAQGQKRKLAHKVFSGTQLQNIGEGHREFSFYIHLNAQDKAGILAKLCEQFAKENISLRFVHQEQSGERGRADLVFISHPTSSVCMRNALSAIGKEGLSCGEARVLRILESGPSS